MTSTPAAALRETLAGLLTPGTLGRDELLDAVTMLGDTQAVLDAVKVRIAGEVADRSVMLGEENPTTRAGQVSPAALLAERWRIPLPAARQFCLVGEATRPR